MILIDDLNHDLKLCKKVITFTAIRLRGLGVQTLARAEI